MKSALIAFAFVLLATAQEAAAQSAELTITGRITPAPCSIELGNGGVADLGDILVKDLKDDDMTSLEMVTLSLKISCESPVRFALQGIDNTNGSSPTEGRYGLGLTPADEKIGDARVTIKDNTADGVQAFATQSADGGGKWSGSGNGGTGEVYMDRLRGWNKEANSEAGPAPIALLLATLRVEARIQPASSLTLDREVPINGNVTLDLIYL